MANTKKSDDNYVNFLKTLENRFNKNKKRHPKTNWSDVIKELAKNDKKLLILMKMEETGGEPDVVELEIYKNKLLFIDCSPETPKLRVSLCYDKNAWDERKEFKPKSNVIDEVNKIGSELIDEDVYNQLQTLETFDQKTSSWLKTPDSIRKLGGAIFGDFRFGRTFVYHNGAQSYYSGRGYRTMLKF